MAYRRYRKKLYKRKRNSKYKRTSARPGRRGVGRQAAVHYYKRHTGSFGSLQIASVADTLVAFNFSLSDLPNVTEFTNLYDCYKINAVKIMFLPQMTQNVSLSSLNNAYASARFFSAIDYNDSGAISVDAIREYATCKFTPILKRHTRYLKPRVQDSGSTYTPGRPWINCTSPAKDYFGLKVAVEGMDSSNVLTMDYTVECVYYLSFKNVK